MLLGAAEAWGSSRPPPFRVGPPGVPHPRTVSVLTSSGGGTFPASSHQPKRGRTGSSYCGKVETNQSSIHEDVSLIPGLVQWARDLVFPV